MTDGHIHQNDRYPKLVIAHGLSLLTHLSTTLEAFHLNLHAVTARSSLSDLNAITTAILWV